MVPWTGLKVKISELEPGLPIHAALETFGYLASGADLEGSNLRPPVLEFGNDYRRQYG